MYVFAFGTAFFILKKVMNEGMLNSKSFTATEDDIFSFIGTGIIFLLVGARVFSALVYDTSGMYRRMPWLIFWPFDTRGHFTGLAGMSYHGGFIGGLCGMIFWCVRRKQPVFKWVDAMVTAIPLGYTFGRLGNFLNGELFGRITTVPWGMLFPNAERFSSSLDWVRAFAEKAGVPLVDGAALVNLPRHPSQLYEAFFEGIVLWAILWLLRRHKKWDGLLSGIYMAGYGFFRFIIEYFREPDAELGYRIAKNSAAPIYTNTSLLNFSTGQVLCFLMIIGGILMALGTRIYYKRRQTIKDESAKD